MAREQKSKFRQRTGRSPDYGDALALAVTPGAPRLKYTPSPEARERAERMAAERRFRDRLFREMLPTGRGLDGMLPTMRRGL